MFDQHKTETVSRDSLEELRVPAIKIMHNNLNKP